MVSSINSNASFGQAVRILAKENGNKDNASVDKHVSENAKSDNTQKIHPSAIAINKKQLNAAILQSSLQFNETIANKPNTLLLKAALQGINDALKNMGVENTVEETYQKSEIDFSPEATADRILSFSTQFFAAYQGQHPEMDEQEAKRSFVDLIGGGIDQGFSEARDVLGGLKVLDGDIADNIDKTYEIIQKGLEEFLKGPDESEQVEEKTESLLS